MNRRETGGARALRWHLTPSTTTVASNTLATYTLTYSCSTTGGCLDSTITIPTDTVTGNGANTDFSGWVSAGTCPALTREAGLITFELGTVATGSYSCNFTVRPPNKITLDGAQAAILPTFSSSGGTTTAPTAAVLNVTAGHNVSMGSGVNPTSVVSGAPMGPQLQPGLRNDELDRRSGTDRTQHHRRPSGQLHVHQRQHGPGLASRHADDTRRGDVGRRGHLHRRRFGMPRPEPEQARLHCVGNRVDER